MNKAPQIFAFWLSLAAMMTACSGSIGSAPAPGPSAPPPMPSGTIKHIVVLLQENRSFNNLFAGFPGATTSMEGLCKPPAKPPDFWCRTEHEVRLHPVTLETYGDRGDVWVGEDICHTHKCLETECDPNASHRCRMDGFDQVTKGEGGGVAAHLFPYAYVDRAETKPYWDFARQYTLADEMFFTETASSFIAHQMILSGTVELKPGEWVTDEPYEAPWGCWSVKGDDAPVLYANGKESKTGIVFPCFGWPTIADLLDAKRVSWLFYVDSNPRPYGDWSGGAWNGFAAIRKVFHGSDWKTNISSPNTNIFSDLKGGTLPSVSWVIPRLWDSDHPSAGCNGGPWWVTSVVNAIGESRYWKDTAIIVVWDDWGGWYDPVAPPYKNPSTLGFRVPMLVISPYAKPGFVSHTQYDFGSILKFQEQTFDLGSLGTTDAPAASLNDAFDYTQAPLAFKSEPSPPRIKACADHETNPKSIAEILRLYGPPD